MIKGVFNFLVLVSVYVFDIEVEIVLREGVNLSIVEFVFVKRKIKLDEKDIIVFEELRNL